MTIDRELLCRLDGFLDAAAVICSPDRALMFGASFIECDSTKQTFQLALQSHKSEQPMRLRESDKSNEEPTKWIERQMKEELLCFQPKVQSEFVWHVMEMLRVLTADFDFPYSAKYSVEAGIFSGTCIAIPLQSGYLAVQFLTKDAVTKGPE
jgi:hypothetical protein